MACSGHYIYKLNTVLCPRDITLTILKLLMISFFRPIIYCPYCLRDYPIDNVGSLSYDVTRPLYILKKIKRVIGVTDATLPLILLFLFCAYSCVIIRTLSYTFLAGSTISNGDIISIRKSSKSKLKR